jgi:hypothetical protein
MKKGLRIKAVYNGKGGTPVTDYNVVDEKGIVQFQGSYTECYYYLFPAVDNNYADKEAFDKSFGE